MYKVISIAAIVLFSVFCEQPSHASTWQICRDWVIDALGVVCKGTGTTTQAAGGLIFFKKLRQNAWQFHSTTAKYPFDIVLPGPGLE